MRRPSFLLALLGLVAPLGALNAQEALDRGDPSIVQEALELDSPREDAEDVELPPAPEAEMSTPDVEGGVLVGAVRVVDSSLPPARFIGAIQPYLGRRLGPQQLQALSTAIARVLHDEGFVFATAWIPPQRLGSGVLRVVVDEGAIDEIRYAGAANAAVEAVMASLANGRPVRSARLERQLLLAEDIPGVSIENPQYFRQDDRGILQLAVIEDRAGGWVELNNHGDSSIGPWRVEGTFNVNGVLGEGDRLTLATVATPFEPADFLLGGIGYQFPLGADGTTAALQGYYAHSKPDSLVQGRDLTGESFGLYAGVSHPIARSRRASLWGWAGARYRKSMQADSGLPLREDRVSTLETGFNAFARLLGGHWSGGGRLVQGIDALGATEPGDPLASRFDADGVFTKFEMWGRWYRQLGGNLALELTGFAQVATGPLLASEEMGIGGPRHGRGFDYYERSGENGVAGALELQYNITNPSEDIDNMQVYGFIDGAAVRNLGDGNGGGRLASAGAGIRVSVGNVEIGVEGAMPINADRFESGDRSPRFRLVVGTSF